mmetsp:Transcript_2369/g.5351  ORF Transcript_2369/g.5351 Transcript_2369/m.5351 type:complete len:245 (+) Transcript_2369:486-1220(+)
MDGARGRFRRGDEARADPDAAGAKGKGSCKSAAVKEPASGHNWNLHAEVVHLALHKVNALGDQRHGRYDASVAARFRALGADDVDALREGLRDVVRSAHHVHDGNARGVELVDGPLRGHAHCTHKESCLLCNDDIDELRQVATCVVLVGLASTVAHLREEQVNAKGHPRLQLLLAEVDLLLHGGGRQVDAAEGANAAGVGHSRHELVRGHGAHTCEHDRVLDLQELRERRLDPHVRHGGGVAVC